jgi:hypothetical protein
MAGAGAVAQAAPTPGPVTVRVEGSNATLIPPTLVGTQPGTVTPINDPTHSCPGTSAMRALDLATLVHATSWSGTFFSFGDYFVTTIAGEQHGVAPGDGSYWSFWYDHAPAQVGICTQQLNPNDEILFFPDCFGTCPAGFVSPDVLGMTAPTVAQRGDPTPVSVISYANADGRQSPGAGDTVSGGGASATTTPAGTATLSFPSVGTFTLTATGPHAVTSEPHTICVHDGNDGNCGTTPAPGTPPPTTPSAPSPPATPAPDKTPPRGHFAIAEGTRIGHGKGPRTLVGHVDPDPSGIRDVLLRVTRVVTHGRCEAYSAVRRRFSTARCGVASAPSFSVGSKPTFSYLLPSRLAKGRYTVDVEAIDGAGNHDAPAPARNRIVFRVE